MSLESSAYHFLENGGEIGELIRAKDWNQTPLGNPENWPQSLKNMVRMMLDNPFGQNIVWGKDYTQIYNDSYSPILGTTKHPEALGSSAKETWSEVWHIIGPMFDAVMKGESISFTDFYSLIETDILKIATSILPIAPLDYKMAKLAAYW